MKMGTIKTSIGVRLRPGSTDGRMVNLHDEGGKMRRYSRDEIIELIKPWGEVPVFVMEASEETKFAFGYTPGGYIPLHRTDEPPPPASDSVFLSINPLAGLEESNAS